MALSRETNLDYGKCWFCSRLMQVKYLTQIRYYEGHKRRGKFHHKLICESCRKGADEIFEEPDI